MSAAMRELHGAIGVGPMPGEPLVCSACRPAGAARDGPAADEWLRCGPAARLPPLPAQAPEPTDAPSEGTPP
jgi:hypothetical protein